MIALRRLLRLIVDDPLFALAIVAAAGMAGLAALAGLPAALTGPLLALLLGLVFTVTLHRDGRSP